MVAEGGEEEEEDGQDEEEDFWVTEVGRLDVVLVPGAVIRRMTRRTLPGRHANRRHTCAVAALSVSLRLLAVCAHVCSPPKLVLAHSSTRRLPRLDSSARAQLRLLSPLLASPRAASSETCSLPRGCSRHKNIFSRPLHIRAQMPTSPPSSSAASLAPRRSQHVRAIYVSTSTKSRPVPILERSAKCDTLLRPLHLAPASLQLLRYVVAPRKHPYMLLTSPSTSARRASRARSCPLRGHNVLRPPRHLALTRLLRPAPASTRFGTVCARSGGAACTLTPRSRRTRRRARPSTSPFPPHSHKVRPPRPHPRPDVCAVAPSRYPHATRLRKCRFCSERTSTRCGTSDFLRICSQFRTFPALHAHARRQTAPTATPAPLRARHAAFALVRRGRDPHPNGDFMGVCTPIRHPPSPPPVPAVTRLASTDDYYDTAYRTSPDGSPAPCTGRRHRVPIRLPSTTKPPVTPPPRPLSPPD